MSNPRGYAVLHAHIYKMPLPPRRINPRIPASVGKVLLYALEKDPGARYQSASEFAADLHAGFLAPRARAIQRLRTTFRDERRPIPRAREKGRFGDRLPWP